MPFFQHWIICGLTFFIISSVYGQENQKQTYVDADFYHGTVLEHSLKIGHLITDHPVGFLIRYNYKTFGKKEWQRRHNYPDWGFSFTYQDMKNPWLGEIYGIFSHINWYFFQRNVQLSVGQGVGYTTNPYDKETNFRNNAYGTQLMSATYLKLNYHKPNIWNKIGLQAGVSFFHFSNGAVKLPNTSTNTFAFNVGVNYQLDDTSELNYIKVDDEPLTEPIKFNLALRFGLNESTVVGLGQYPFFIVVAQLDKRLSRSSSVVVGSELFVSYFLRELINYNARAIPEESNSNDHDFKRAGIFVGYQFRINKLAPFVNLGYYYYRPYTRFGNKIYNRIGIKRYFGQKEEIYGLLSVKSHAAKAEALEFGIGYRF